jgi:hypothetical protein
MTELEIGQRLRNRLIREGGFVWSHKDGTKTVHFNRGKKPSAELVAALKKYRKALAKFIDHYHEMIDRAYKVKLPRLRFSQR